MGGRWPLHREFFFADFSRPPASLINRVQKEGGRTLFLRRIKMFQFLQIACLDQAAKIGLAVVVLSASTGVVGAEVQYPAGPDLLPLLKRHV